jgi:hypothetical protein
MRTVMHVKAGRDQIKWMAQIGMVLLTGCAGAPLPPSGTPPPAWLDRLPASQEELCAVGVSGPAYYQQDALAKSTSLGFTELSRSVQVRVTSEMAVRQQGESSGRSDIAVQEVSAFASDVVVRLAQVRAQWINPGGYPNRGEAGIVYTLVCMPLKGIGG